jgi:hypothetical protein
MTMHSFLVASFLALCCLGCGRNGYAELGLIDVNGLVTLDGAPLSGAKVTFEGEDKRQAIGITDTQGRYELLYDSQTGGATPGLKTVRVTTADLNFEGGGLAEGAPEAKERIPARYNSASGLKAQVSAAKRTFDFELKSKP